VWSQVDNFHLQAVFHVQLCVCVMAHHMQASVLFSNSSLNQQTSVSWRSLLGDSEMSVTVRALAIWIRLQDHLLVKSIFNWIKRKEKKKTTSVCTVHFVLSSISAEGPKVQSCCVSDSCRWEFCFCILSLCILQKHENRNFIHCVQLKYKTKFCFNLHCYILIPLVK